MFRTLHVKNGCSLHTFIFDNFLDLINWVKNTNINVYSKASVFHRDGKLNF